MDCTLMLTAVYAAAAVISMAVTACSAIETKKILGQIEKELSKTKDNDNDVLIPDGTGTEYQGRDADAQDAQKSSIKKYAVKMYAASQEQDY
ncbi:MAG: hypothetical protein K2K35_04950 [Lachnospiraceae bacterium]|nr:hypothetical protein [Lachnospiraceae bacterium]